MMIKFKNGNTYEVAQDSTTTAVILTVKKFAELDNLTAEFTEVNYNGAELDQEAHSM